MRINVYLANTLGWSRRQADRAIEQKAVKVNGKQAKLGQQIDPENDRLTAYGKRVPVRNPRKNQKPITIALYKPKGYVVSRSDPQGRKTIMDLLPKEFRTLKPAGRLDYTSEGLLLISNDGGLINKLTHPRYEKQKEYLVTLEKPVTNSLLAKFTAGVELKEGIAKAFSAEKIGKHEIRMILQQGWNRQIRRMTDVCGNSAIRIIRTRIGDIQLGNLKPGEWRTVEEEI